MMQKTTIAIKIILYLKNKLGANLPIDSASYANLSYTIFPNPSFNITLTPTLTYISCNNVYSLFCFKKVEVKLSMVKLNYNLVLDCKCYRN